MNAEKQIRQWCDTLPGWCTFEKAMRLYQLAFDAITEIPHPYHVSLELGVFGGRSLFPIALAHKHAMRGCAIGIDTWDNVAPLSDENNKANNEWWATVPIGEVREQCYRDRDHFKLMDRCRLFTVRTTDPDMVFLVQGKLILIHQDSSHNFSTIKAELDAWASHLAPGGYWVTDDNDWPETKEGYALLPEYGLELFEDHVSWQIWRKKI